jgi:Tol biopolymer transport system component
MSDSEQRWRILEDLYQAAMEREPSARAAFLSEACPDADLRREVESLIAAYEASRGDFLERPALRYAVQQLEPGAMLGQYRIEQRIGAGGMGEVYRATDTRLRRAVALKVLRALYAQDPEWLARFEREARVLASLNHPHIAAIYGLEQSAPRALALELVDGPTLAERLGRGRMPFEQALAAAKQIAEALEYAHEKGVVHRDLKPANIKITSDGAVKVLDFGLAKAAMPTDAGDSSTMTMTKEGAILGTPAYMAPEQAKGLLVDKRADIWAFGVVLFEMLTGHRAFPQGTAAEVLASVVRDEPNWEKLPSETPEAIRRLLKRCLERDPKRRLRDIGEARILLDEPAAAPAAAPPQPRRKWLPWAVAGAALTIAAVAAGIAWLRPAAPDAVPGAIRFTIPLPAEASWPTSRNSTEWVPSPDGRNLALIAEEGGRNALWVRPLGVSSAHRLDKTEGANYPFWSPDGQSIGFFNDNSLQRISVSGAAAGKICDLPPLENNTNPGDGGAWNQDGVIVFGITGHPLLRVSAMGGISSPATTLEKDEAGHYWPQFLPDGRHVLYWARGNSGSGAIYVQELGSPKRVLVMKSLTRAMWSPPGYLLFPREGNLFAQRMNPRTFQLEEKPLLAAEEVESNQANGRSSFAISQNGVLVYRSGVDTVRQITWRDRGGRVLSQVGKPGRFTRMALSPDGKSAALTVMGEGDWETWVMDLASGVITPMIRNGKRDLHAVWSPDSKRLGVSQAEAGLQVIMVASGKTESFTGDVPFCDAWEPDGRSILCSDASGTRLQLVPLEQGAKVQTVLATSYWQGDFRFSPDGRYVAYESGETGEHEVYVASFPSFAVKRRVSTNGGTYPAWAKGGKELFYRATDGNVIEVDIRTGSGIEIGEPRFLFKLGRSPWSIFSVTADGQHFLTNEPVSQTSPETPELTLLINWPAGMKQP